MFIYGSLLSRNRLDGVLVSMAFSSLAQGGRRPPKLSLAVGLRPQLHVRDAARLEARPPLRRRAAPQDQHDDTPFI